MKFAITGATGFVGRHIARVLSQEGHELVLIARGQDRNDLAVRALKHSLFVTADVKDASPLARAFSGCQGIVHCAGINREIGKQTFEKVHVEGTRRVVDAARGAGVRKIVLLSFLRARPNCGSGYHESKWAAEQIVRQSGLDYTILKCGVIYGRGDHMLNHLSRAFQTFPVFAFVGFGDRPIRPTAVEDVTRIIRSSVLEGLLSQQTVPVSGPEEMGLREAVRRVARVVGRHPFMFPMPVWFHYFLAWSLEKFMTVPLTSLAQVRILSEGVSDPAPPYDPLPMEFAPQIAFTEAQIRKGLPPAGRFGLRDLRFFQARTGREPRRKIIPFLEWP